MDIFKNIFKRKASAAGHIIVQQPFKEHSPNRDYKALSDEGYRKNVVAKRCIDYIGASVADIKVNLFSKRTEAEILNHELMNLLSNPNPIQGYEEYTRTLISFFMLHGNLYSEAVYGSRIGKDPQELWSQRPDRMKIVPGKNAMPVAYTLSANGKKHTWQVDQITGTSPILHVKTFNPLDDYYGMSFLESAAFSVDQFNQSMIWNVSLLKNGARPPGAFVIEKTNDPNFQGLTADQRAQIRSEITEIYTGSGNAGRPMLLEGGLNYKEMGLSPKDMDWIQSKNTSTRDICMAFGVPPQLVGVTGDSTYANYEQARMAFYDNTAIPLAKLYSKALTRWLTPMYDNAIDLEIRPDIDSIEALAPRRKAKWDMVSNSTFLSANEKRIETGFGKYIQTDEAADQIFINSGLIPIEFASDFGTEPLTDTEDVTGAANEDDDDDDEKINQNNVEFKAFNLSSSKKKRSFWLQQTRKMRSSEIKMRNKVAVRMIKEGKQMAKELDNADPLVWKMIVDQVLDDNKDAMQKTIATSIDDVMRDFSKQVVSNSKDISNQIEHKFNEDRFESFLSNYIKATSAESVTNITNTTRRRVKNLFKRLSKENEDLSAVDISKQIGTLYKGFTPSRSLTIARTEVHNSAMTAQLKTAESLDIPNLKKEWISSSDERSRDGSNGPNHVEMDGIIVEMDAKFEVQGGTGVDYLDSPGDPNAPAAQTINCRCVVAFTSGE